MELLSQKLEQSSSIYDHDATKADILHRKIRKVMRRVKRHPMFSDIENDITEVNFYIAWGMLEAESLRWSQGPGLREDRGKVAREQRAISWVLWGWGVDVGDVYGEVQDDKGKKKTKASNSDEKNRAPKEAKGDVDGALDKKRERVEAKITRDGGKQSMSGRTGFKRILHELSRDGRYKAK